MLSSEDRSNESGVRMTPATQVSGHGLGVERRSVMRDGQAIAPVFQQKPVRDAASTWQPGAAGIEGADTADKAIVGSVRMATDDNVGAASG
jgi:hypothetical protein